ncbi:hypothetical protein [Saccharopolyspora endophytica]|uniref:Uncharacterized protein n=1 Tax=Saccharopolyspora endophytica TaxID=543886 RepID=A0ABS5DPJ5_9PSEU|nr:hypothetical protein [Saccharopolyspora endophytica]MBQ0927967.1 hypothetical protein [Saccharopolyspora endophytica]
MNSEYMYVLMLLISQVCCPIMWALAHRRPMATGYPRNWGNGPWVPDNPYGV